MTALTVADIEAGYANPDWLGYGYLGERRSGMTDTARVDALDARIVAEANARGWTPAQFFDWLNSKNGRWAAEAWFHSDTFERDLPKLMQVIR